MRGVPNLDGGRARKRRAWIDEIDGIEHACAVLALIAAGAVIAAMRACPDHIAVGEEALVGVGIDLLGRAHFQMAVLPQGTGEMLGERVVGRVGRTAEMVPGEIETFATFLLPGIKLVAELPHALSGFGGGELGRRAMLVGRAECKRLKAASPAKARETVGRQERADKRAQMLDAIDVWQGAGDEKP